MGELLDRRDLRDEMLVLGGLVLRRQLHMPLDLADDGDAVHGPPRGMRGDGAGLGDAAALGRRDGGDLFCHGYAPLRLWIILSSV